MEDFNLDALELNLEDDDFDIDDCFEVSPIDEEDDEVIEDMHIKVATKDFLNMLKKAKTIISVSARDLITKAVCLSVKDGMLVVKCTDFDVYMELKCPLINNVNILEDVIVTPIDNLIQVAKALPSKTVLFKDENDKIRINLIGGSIDLETLNVGEDKFTMRDEVVEDKDIDAQEFYSLLTAFSPVINASVNPMEKRILFSEDGAKASYMFSIVSKEGDFPKFDVKPKDLSVLKNLLTQSKGKLRTYRTADEKASSRFIIEDDFFKYAFLIGDANVNKILDSSFKESDFNLGAYIEFNKIIKLVELSSALNYATGKIKMKFMDMNTVQLHVPTKNGDNTFKIDATPNSNINIGTEVEVSAKLFLTVLKAFQKRSILTLYCDKNKILISNDDYKGLILLDA